MLIVDFSKAFDVVPHIRLLRKLEHYGIKGKILEWIRAWLTQRQQCVAVEGETSGEAHVKPGVPQVTVLGCW
jgi:methylaspartate ammonia-lyase